MPDFSRLSQAFATFTFAIILAGCNTTTDTSYEPETQLSDGKVVEVTQVKKPNKISPRLEAKLAQRKTINPFAPWLEWYASMPGITSKSYDLTWNGTFGWQKWTCEHLVRSSAINLVQSEWQAVQKPWKLHSGSRYLSDKFISNKLYRYNNGSAPYGDYSESDPRYFTELGDAQLPNALVDAWTRATSWKSCTSPDGVIFDYWHAEHPEAFNKETISSARRRIVEKFRATFGDDFLVMANVNWNHDKKTSKSLNGVFLELWKDKSDRLYTLNELKKVEKILIFYEQNLRFPKLIALEGWRKTLSLTQKDRMSDENVRMAKLLTAMSVVVPSHGYILYSDNNRDDQRHDHYHSLYDFYSFDIGKPTGPRVKVSNGVSYKQHQEGFIAYNITSRAKSFEINGSNRTVSIEAKSGLFCKETGDAFDCLAVD